MEDEGLLEEVAGLVEWPVVLMGSFDAAFLDIPAEAIRATIRANQKCFVLREPGSERLAPAFVLVSNLVASDGGFAITAGNERVVRARLSDAKFFWETDKANRLDDRLPKLDSIVFHEKLGTQGSGWSASRHWRVNSPSSSVPTRIWPSARRVSRRRISSPRWSASFPSFRA